MQYTLRDMPAELDRRIREICAQEGRPFDEVVLQLLRSATGLAEGLRLRDLSDVVGTWVSDPPADEALQAQRVVDEDLWR